MSQDDTHRVGMIEVLLNEKLSTEEQIVIDWGELNVPTNDVEPELNTGPIYLSGGDQFLLTTKE